MAQLRDLEIGIMLWAGRDPLTIVQEAKSLGVRCGQLGLPGSLALDSQAQPWIAALTVEQFSLVTIFCAYEGESYVDVPTVKRTVGFIPAATRAERLARTLEVSDFAAAIGVSSIACHIGFVPEDASDPDYQAVCDVVRRVCDHAAKNRQTFALETGQEPADVLLKFVDAVGRPNLGINFDPANMILYGTGDPILALSVLGPKLLSVHAKDGSWPPKNAPNALGKETPLGEGAVGVEQFMAKLKQIGYKGTVNIEREVEDHSQWLADVKKAVGLLQSLRG